MIGTCEHHQNKAYNKATNDAPKKNPLREGISSGHIKSRAEKKVDQKIKQMCVAAKNDPKRVEDEKQIEKDQNKKRDLFWQDRLRGEDNDEDFLSAKLAGRTLADVSML